MVKYSCCINQKTCFLALQTNIVSKCNVCSRFLNRIIFPLYPWFEGLKSMFVSSPVKYFTDRSKAVFLLWILYGFLCLVFAVPLSASVYMCLMVSCWERADLLALVCGVWLWVSHFPIGILGQVWYLIVSITDLCTLTYFEDH